MELLNLICMSYWWQVELEGLGEDISISLAQQVYSKAQGVEEIHPEMPKALDTVVLTWLTCFFNDVWRSGSVPRKWRTGVVSPISKKGDGDSALII